MEQLVLHDLYCLSLTIAVYQQREQTMSQIQCDQKTDPVWVNQVKGGDLATKNLRDPKKQGMVRQGKTFENFTSAEYVKLYFLLIS